MVVFQPRLFLAHEPVGVSRLVGVAGSSLPTPTPRNRRRADPSALDLIQTASWGCRFGQWSNTVQLLRKVPSCTLQFVCLKQHCLAGGEKQLLPARDYRPATRSACSNRWNRCSPPSRRTERRPLVYAREARPRCTEAQIPTSSFWISSLAAMLARLL